MCVHTSFVCPIMGEWERERQEGERKRESMTRIWFGLDFLIEFCPYPLSFISNINHINYFFTGLFLLVSIFSSPFLHPYAILHMYWTYAMSIRYAPTLWGHLCCFKAFFKYSEHLSTGMCHRHLPLYFVFSLFLVPFFKKKNSKFREF